MSDGEAYVEYITQLKTDIEKYYKFDCAGERFIKVNFGDLCFDANNFSFQLFVSAHTLRGEHLFTVSVEEYDMTAAPHVIKHIDRAMNEQIRKAHMITTAFPEEIGQPSNE